MSDTTILTIQFSDDDNARLSAEAEAGKTLQEFLEKRLVGQAGIISVKVIDVLEKTDRPEDDSPSE